MKQLLFLSVLTCATIFCSTTSLAKTITGYVFYDENRNGILDSNEKGAKNVPVSNLDDVVLTDKNGFFSLDAKNANYIVATKLSHFQFPLNKYNEPKNYHRINGETSDILYFPIYKDDATKERKALIIGDPQMGGELQLGYFKKGQIPMMKNQNADFFLVLGDIADYDLTLFPKEQQVMATLSIPAYRTIGNHDHDTKAKNDADASIPFENAYGPVNYSFEYNNYHFIVLDDIDYEGYNTKKQKNGNYCGGLNAQQLRWIANDLSYTDKSKNIIIATHIPLTNEETRQGTLDSLSQILSDRENVLYLSGHTHAITSYTTENNGHKHEGLVAGATCGAWWTGPFTEYGLPYATCMDGSPQGFFVFDFSKDGYKKQFIPAHYPASFQIYAEYAPTINGNIEVTANWFTGKPTDKVSLVLNNGIVQEMTNYTGTSHFVERTLKLRSNSDSWTPSIQATDHLWKIEIDSVKLKKGTNQVEITGEDQHGNQFSTMLIIEKP